MDQDSGSLALDQGRCSCDGRVVRASACGPDSYGAYLATFLELPKREDHPPLRLYTAPFQLKSDLSLKEARLSERLQRLGYRRCLKTVQSPGDYQLTEEALTIYLHPQPESLIKAVWSRCRSIRGW